MIELRVIEDEVYVHDEGVPCFVETVAGPSRAIAGTHRMRVEVHVDQQVGLPPDDAGHPCPECGSTDVFGRLEVHTTKYDPDADEVPLPVKREHIICYECGRLS